MIGISLLRISLPRSPFNLFNLSSQAVAHLPLHTKLCSSKMATCAYTTSSQPPSKLLFRQLFEKDSSTYTYLLADVSHPQKPALETFCNIMQNLKLAYPKMIDVAVPANMVCGLQDLSAETV